MAAVGPKAGVDPKGSERKLTIVELVDWLLEDKMVELRLSTLPTAFGEKLVMRIFDPTVLVRDFKELGFSEEDSARWKEMTEKPNGIVQVTGPTGSGKTTTLYTTLKQLATPDVNVCTVEDPIEMVEGSFNQMQVTPAIELGFAEGLRAVYKPVGCLECRMTGFVGRVGIYETLTFPGAIKEIVGSGADLARIRDQAYRDGMKALRISGAMKVAAGITTMEVLRNAPPARDTAS